MACLILLPALALAGPVQDRKLVDAVSRADLAAIDDAVQAGADIDANIRLLHGNLAVTPLLAAVLAGSPEAVDLILAKGADPASNDHSALRWAIRLNDATAVTRLLAKIGSGRADVAGILMELAVRMPERRVSDLRQSFWESFTDDSEELYERFRYLELVGRAERPDSPGFDAIIAAFVEHGYSPDPDTGATLARQAVARGDTELVMHLRERYGVTTDTAQTQLQAKLVAAAGRGETDAVQELITAGAKVDMASPSDQFALPAAAGSGNVATVKLLLDAGAPVDMSGGEQNRALIAAAERGDIAVAMLLLDAGARNSPGGAPEDWPLRAATRAGMGEMVGLLIERGAKPNDLDTQRRSVLHAMVVHDGFMRPRKRLGVEHLAMPARLQAVGFGFSNPGFTEDVISGNIVGEKFDLAFLKSLRAAGASVTQSALRSGILDGNADLLRWLIGESTVADASAVLAYAGARIREPGFLLLIAHGAKPLNDADALDMAREAIIWGAPRAFAALLGAGYRPPADTQFRLLSDMVDYGRADMLAMLLEQGADPNSVDESGYSVLHRWVRNDATAGNGVVRLTPPRIAALAVLVGGGLDPTRTNRLGQTVAQDAARRVETQRRLEDVYAAAGGTGSPLHAAVRAGDMFKVAALLATGAEPNMEDRLGRTPLTLALQLRMDSIAEHLLLSGAAFSFVPRNAFQKADIDYPRSERLDTALRLRLLRDKRIDLGPAGQEQPPLAIVARFEANQAQPLPDLQWKIRCVHPPQQCGVSPPITLAGDPATAHPPQLASLKWLATSLRRELPDGVHYWLVQERIVQGLAFSVEGALTIPACLVDFGAEANCYPAVEIHNPNDPYELAIRDSLGGSVSVPGMDIIVTQNGEAQRVPPDASRTFDRSRGPLTLSFSRQSRLYSSSVEVRWKAGPPRLAAKIADAARTALYADIGRLQDRHQAIRDRLTAPAQGAELAPAIVDGLLAEQAALRAAVRLRSADATLKYPETVANNLNRRVQDMLELDQNLVTLHRALNADGMLTAPEVELQLALIRAQLVECPADGCTDLREILPLLERAQAALAGSSEALHTLLGQFETQVDRYARDYQSLILEYAQYVDLASMASIVTPGARTAIRAKLTGRDTIINDQSAGGRGRALRVLFGLPEPTP